MNLPYYALFLVREFSRPVTRIDWRTCKTREANIIKDSIIETRLNIQAKLLVYAKSNPFQNNRYKEVGRDVETWTHYGRSKILKQAQGWMRRDPPEEYYLNRYWFMMP